MPEPVVASVPARVGLVGNPSDGFGGAVLAAVVDRWSAEARATPAGDGISIHGERVPVASWPTGAALDAAARDTDAPHAIVVAALDALHRHLDGGLGAVTVGWSSTIPRSVGLAGSSAIAIAVIEAVAGCLAVQLDAPVVAALALDAEVRGMSIAAGWQDRMVQAHRGAVLVDAAELSATPDGIAVPTVRRLDGLDLDAVIGWRDLDAEGSGGYHGALRRRTDREAVETGMQHLAALARRAARAIDAVELDDLRRLVDQSWRSRQTVAPLDERHTQLVETVRATGAATSSPGSGGSVVALPNGEPEAEAVIDALEAVGATARRVRLR